MKIKGTRDREEVPLEGYSFRMFSNKQHPLLQTREKKQILPKVCIKA